MASASSFICRSINCNALDPCHKKSTLLEEWNLNCRAAPFCEKVRLPFSTDCFFGPLSYPRTGQTVNNKPTGNGNEFPGERRSHGSESKSGADQSVARIRIV